MFRIIDTHCHLEDSLFDQDLDDVAITARNENIAIISSAITKESWSKGLDIASRYSHIFPSLGLNPTQFSDSGEAVEFIRENSDDLIAIGEIGLDHYLIREHSDRVKQLNGFNEMLQLAVELGLPVQVHSRSAGKATLEVLYKSEIVNVHMHAFDGKSGYARTASEDYGYYFSIPTSVIRSPQKQKLVKAVALERLLLETDSPVLAPIKGERNVPTNISVALAEVSRILRKDEEEMRAIILENSYRLYKKLR